MLQSTEEYHTDFPQRFLLFFFFFFGLTEAIFYREIHNAVPGISTQLGVWKEWETQGSRWK